MVTLKCCRSNLRTNEVQPPHSLPKQKKWQITPARLAITLLTFSALGLLYKSLTTTPLAVKNNIVVSDSFANENHVGMFFQRCQGIQNRECNAYNDWLRHSDQTPIGEAITSLQLCPQAKELWQNVNKKRKVAIVQLPSSEVPTGRMLAQLDTILLGNNQSTEDKLYWLLFETHSLSRKDDLLLLQDQAGRGELSRENFAKDIEKFKYQTALENYKMNKNCIDGGFWKLKDPRSFLMDAYLPKLFELWWNIIKNNANTENQRNQWDSLFKQAYCEKHPHEKDCKAS